MSVSKIAICNSALLKVGEERISSIDENNKRAKILKEQYEKVRDDVLRSHPWNFALKRVQLAQSTATPSYGFDYYYVIPSDCLRILEVSPDMKYQVEGGLLLSDETTVKIRYIAKITDTTHYDPNFVEAFALRLAADIAYPLVNSVNLKQSLLGEYSAFIQDARTFNGQEGSPQDFAQDYWLNARLGGVSYDEVQ